MITDSMLRRRKDLLKLMNLVVLSDFTINDENLWNEWNNLLGSDESAYDEVAKDNERFHCVLRMFLVMNAQFYAAEDS